MEKLKLTIFIIIFLVGAYFTVFIPFVGLILGFFCMGIATPKTDGRFKTGFKNNEEVNKPLAALGLLWLTTGILTFFLLPHKDKPPTQSSSISQSVQIQGIEPVQIQSMQPVRTQSRQQTVTARDSAISLLNQMITIAADDGGVGRAEELNSLKQRIDALPKPAQGDKQRAWMANDNGLAAYKVGQYEQAKEYFLSAYQADPTDAEIANNLVLVYLNLGDSKKVIETLTTALTLDPGRPASWLYLATYYALQGQQQVAVACYVLTYHFAPNPNKVLELLQKLATEPGEPKVQQAAQQALQLSLFQEETGD